MPQTQTRIICSHKCFTSPGMGGRVTLMEGNGHPCSPCLCFSHRKQRQHYSLLSKVGEVTSVKGLKPLDGKYH